MKMLRSVLNVCFPICHYIHILPAQKLVCLDIDDNIKVDFFFSKKKISLKCLLKTIYRNHHKQIQLYVCINLISFHPYQLLLVKPEIRSTSFHFG